MFGKFFERKSHQPKKEIPVVSEQPSIVIQPAKQEFEISDFSVNRAGERVIIYMPVAILRAVGGERELTRNIFPSIFNGSWPIWSESLGDLYAIEIPDDPKKIEEFKRSILNKI